MRILYLADIRFPLERANGIQSMETCHALASRGHDVMLIVRPDSHQPARDPFDFYGLPHIPGLHVDVAPVTGPIAARRAGYLTFALGRAIGTARQDLIFTRDLGLASLVLRLPRALRAPLVYEAHTIAADAAAARPQMIANAPAASAAKLRRLTGRDQRVWRGADGYVTITDGLRRELETRFGPRARTAVVPDGTRVADVGSLSSDARPLSSDARPLSSDARPLSSDARALSSHLRPPSPFVIGYAGHLYPWKGVEIVVEAVAALTDTRGLIVGGHDKEPDLERVRAFAKQLSCESRITFTGLLPPPQVAARLTEADVLLLPNPKSAMSNAFTSPLKLFEYMAAGRPIVASDLPSIREVLRDDHNALLVEPGNPQAFVQAVARIKDDAALGNRLAARAAADVAQYTWAARAERLDALFASVIGTGA